MFRCKVALCGRADFQNFYKLASDLLQRLLGHQTTLVTRLEPVLAKCGVEMNFKHTKVSNRLAALHTVPGDLRCPHVTQWITYPMLCELVQSSLADTVDRHLLEMSASGRVQLLRRLKHSLPPLNDAMWCELADLIASEVALLGSSFTCQTKLHVNTKSIALFLCVRLCMFAHCFQMISYQAG